MDVISLPLLSNQDSLHLALARLKSYERAGVVVREDSDHFRLLHAGKLLTARADGYQLLSQVAGGEEVYVMTSVDVSNYSVDLVQPLATPGQYQSMFNAPAFAFDFALVGVDQDIAMIVTRSETKKEALQGSGGYECNGTPKHFFPEPRVTARQNCPLCIPGSLPGGGTPIISPAP